MVDIAHEHLIAIRDVPKHLPRRASGCRIHVSAVYRWISRGVQDVRLASVKVGGTTYTSVEALQAFAQQLSCADPVSASSVVRRRQIDRAKREAVAILQIRHRMKRSR